MTRLYYEIIKDIPSSMQTLDKILLGSTGHTLLGLAARTVKEPYATVAGEIRNYVAAVVPVSSGAGVIPGFAEGVAAVLRHIGLEAAITRQTDVAGIGEAFNSGADIFFAADDRRFLAFNLKNSLVVDNARATAAGFVQALAAAAEKDGAGLAGREVLVLGLGPVGSHAVRELQKFKARVWVHDNDPARLQSFAGLHPDIGIAANIRTAVEKINYVLDATPAAGIIDEAMIQPSTLISCPGVPHGLTPAALARAGGRFIHDNLPLGVATMAVQIIFGIGL